MVHFLSHREPFELSKKILPCQLNENFGCNKNLLYHLYSVALNSLGLKCTWEERS